MHLHAPTTRRLVLIAILILSLRPARAMESTIIESCVAHEVCGVLGMCFIVAARSRRHECRVFRGAVRSHANTVRGTRVLAQHLKAQLISAYQLISSYQLSPQTVCSSLSLLARRIMQYLRRLASSPSWYCMW